MTADEVIARTAELCRKYHAREVVLFGSRAKGTALERSDIDIAVSGVEGFDALLEEVEENFVYSRSSGYGYMREWIIVGGHQAVWTKNLEEDSGHSKIPWILFRRRAAAIWRIHLS